MKTQRLNKSVWKMYLRSGGGSGSGGSEGGEGGTSGGGGLKR